MIKGKIATAKITWREEIVEDEGNFYFKLSPDVRYNACSLDNLANDVAKEGLRQIKQGVKGVK